MPIEESGDEKQAKNSQSVDCFGKQNKSVKNERTSPNFTASNQPETKSQKTVVIKSDQRS